jgi:UDP-N-acetylglucosamine 2-epimerase (non-hydrolysing)
LAAFYKNIKIAHIEAGLRTNNIYSPFPEEANRQITSVLANYHFAPTDTNKENLLKENKNINNIIVTGNTVIDALFLALNKIKTNTTLELKIKEQIKSFGYSITDNKIILVTGHRRENHGQGFVNICQALSIIAKNNPDIDIVYPVHLNPNVLKPVTQILENIKNIFLIKPLEYEQFVYIMDKSYFIITDSGGVQEEAPSLGKPVLVMRDVTERVEAVKSNTVKLTGTNTDKIVNEANKLLNNKKDYELMSKAHNPYGDGNACVKIIDFLKKL